MGRPRKYDFSRFDLKALVPNGPGISVGKVRTYFGAGGIAALRRELEFLSWSQGGRFVWSETDDGDAIVRRLS